MIQFKSEDELAVWPNGGLLPTHDEADAIIGYFTEFKTEHSPAEIECNNREVMLGLSQPKTDTKSESPQRNATAGYVYIVRSENLYKIGRTQYPSSRIDKYRTENPYLIEMILLAKVEDYIRVEKVILTMFASKKHHGEWFSLDEQDIVTIKDEIISNGGLLVELPTI